MTTDELTSKPLYSLADLLQRRVVSPVELIDAFLNQIEKTNDTLHAYITIARKTARQAAKEAEIQIQKGNYQGSLHGIPYACKDLFSTKNILTTGGSRVLADWIPEEDAKAISCLSAAGGILLGKLNQHEFAYGATGKNEHFGTVTNPWDHSRLAGGSSSGSAAAVAAGLASYALGTDTGGSTRAPAALCGVVGFKPTYGLISTKGIIPYCWSLDHVGIFSKTVQDAAIVFEYLTDRVKPGRHRSQKSNFQFNQTPLDDMRKVRIGVPRTFFFDRMDEEIHEAVKKAIMLCGQCKAELIDIDMPPMEKTRTVSLVIQLPEMLSYHSRYLPEKKDLYGKDLCAGMALGQFILAEHYIRAKRMVEWYRMKMEESFKQVDLIITPSCPIIAPKIDSDFIEWGDKKEPVGNAITRYTSFFNMTGHPAISIPCGIHSSGLPMGVQLVGHHFDENTLLKVAHVLENSLKVVFSEKPS
ncbi:MAG: amidase [Proteobacteria bacterium]|nr:amidase [Pseudomonadota bacterium]